MTLFDLVNHLEKLNDNGYCDYAVDVTEIAIDIENKEITFS